MTPAQATVQRMRRDLRRGSFLLPTALTMANIGMGYFSIVKSFGGEFLDATLLLVAAAVLDKFDGVVARATGTVSDLGRELDSLADVISFGVAPSLLAFAWGLEPLGRLGWAGAFLFVACGALRLARFNVLSDTADRRFFIGLPIPMAASVPVTLILAHALVTRAPGLPDGTSISERGTAFLFLALMVAVALLMVSRIRYLSFKDLPIGPEHRGRAGLALALVAVAILGAPQLVLPGLAASYMAHGPLMRLARWQPAWTRTPPAPAALGDEEDA